MSWYSIIIFFVVTGLIYAFITDGTNKKYSSVRKWICFGSLTFVLFWIALTYKYFFDNIFAWVGLLAIWLSFFWISDQLIKAWDKEADDRKSSYESHQQQMKQFNEQYDKTNKLR